MGIEGIAIAAVIVLFIAIVLPALMRGRTVAAEVPADERFAPELRMLRERSYSHTDTAQDRCKIFTTERMMETNKMKERTRHTDERTSTVRALARRRSHAKASIAARGALRTRFAVGAAFLVGVSIISWVLVFSLKIAAAIPLVLTFISVLYIAGFIYLLKMWHGMDSEDTLAIAEAEDRLDAMNVHRAASPRKERAAHTRISHAHDEACEVSSIPAEESMLSDDAVRKSKSVEDGSAVHSAHEREANRAEDRAQLSQNRRERQQGEHKQSDHKQSDHAPESCAATAEKHAHKAVAGSARERFAALRETQTRKDCQSAPAEKIVVPTYTLKPSHLTGVNGGKMQGAHDPLGVRNPLTPRRSAVEIFDSSAPVDTPVPYRPKMIGERMGEAAMNSAVNSSAEDSAVRHEEIHEEMRNSEDCAIAYEEAEQCQKTECYEETEQRQEVRQDVLGVGDTLDSILARRRA